MLIGNDGVAAAVAVVVVAAADIFGDDDESAAPLILLPTATPIPSLTAAAVIMSRLTLLPTVPQEVPLVALPLPLARAPALSVSLLAAKSIAAVSIATATTVLSSLSLLMPAHDDDTAPHAPVSSSLVTAAAAGITGGRCDEDSIVISVFASTKSDSDNSSHCLLSLASASPCPLHDTAAADVVALSADAGGGGGGSVGGGGTKTHGSVRMGDFAMPAVAEAGVSAVVGVATVDANGGVVDVVLSPRNDPGNVAAATASSLANAAPAATVACFCSDVVPSSSSSSSSSPACCLLCFCSSPPSSSEFSPVWTRTSAPLSEAGVKGLSSYPESATESSSSSSSRLWLRLRL